MVHNVRHPVSVIAVSNLKRCDPLDIVSVSSLCDYPSDKLRCLKINLYPFADEASCIIKYMSSRKVQAKSLKILFTLIANQEIFIRMVWGTLILVDWTMLRRYFESLLSTWYNVLRLVGFGAGA